MKIDQAIVDKTGRALIERGAFLDDFHIEYLAQKGVNGIYIQEGDEEDPEEINAEIAALEKNMPKYTRELIEKERVEDRSKVTISESVKKQVGEGVQYLFNNTNDDEHFAESTENVSKELMHAVLDNDAVAFDINMLKVSDEYTFKHSVDVATVAMIIGKNYGLVRDQIHDIGVAGLLHDLGKTKIPGAVLNKPAKLDENEFALMKQHSLFGFQILKDKQEFNEDIMRGVLQHHEKINGSGYPLGVGATKIHTYAKIISVADVYDALVTARPYKSAFTAREAIEMIMAMTGDLEMKAMHSFLSSVVLYPVDSVVKLSNGEYCKVVKNDPAYALRPTVVGMKTGRLYDLANDVKCTNLIIG
ncbi:MAG: HD-GYP domain-containing protein [Lachnospiraceae bacterium]|nr:HD-GYP domain-containing protein [Lachnospiraceae bacterium]